MAYEKIANLKGPKGNGVANPRVVGDDLVLDLVDGTVVTGQVTVGNVRGNTGARGVTGGTGPTGPAPDMTVVVESLDAGSEPTVWKSGTNAAPTITLGIPDGEKGERGVPGPVPQIQFSARALSAGLNPTIARVGGTDDAPAVEIGIPHGDEGPSGPAPSLIFESPQLLAPGAQPYVNVANPRPGEYRLQLGIPQGVPGTATESIRDDQVSTSSSWSSQKTQQEIADSTPAWNAITGKPSTFPAETHSHSYDSITGKPSSFTPSAHTHAYSELTGVPSTFTPATHSHSWSQVTGKPSTFQPATHSHTASEVTGQFGVDQMPSALSFEGLQERSARVLSGAADVSWNPLLSKLRAGVMGNGRCAVVVVGDSFARAQEGELNIGFAERLAYGAGAGSFPLLDTAASRPSSGMTWWQGAQGGTTTADYLPEARLGKIKTVAPDYVFHAIGVSDHFDQVANATFRANLRAGLERIEADTPGVVNIVVQMPARPDARSKITGWEWYGKWMAEVVAEKPSSRLFFDASAPFDVYDLRRAGNNWAFTHSTDGVHPSDNGHRGIAVVLANALGIPVDPPYGPRYWSTALSETGKDLTANTTVAEIVLAKTNYPRIVEMTSQAMMTGAIPSGGWAELQMTFNRTNGTNRDAALRTDSGGIESRLLTRSLFLPPGQGLTVRTVIRMGGSGTKVRLQAGGAYGILQVVERPH